MSAVLVDKFEGKCPICLDQGWKSRVHGGDGGYRTLMAFSSFWDEAGVRHSHDPNWLTSQYQCSNGHAFAVKSRQPCPAGDYP